MDEEDLPLVWLTASYVVTTCKPHHLDVIDLARENYVILFCLPPTHYTHSQTFRCVVNEIPLQ